MNRSLIIVADRGSSYPNERLYTFHDNTGRGGMLAFRAMPDDPAHPLRVEVYRTDPGVLVSHTATDATGHTVPGDVHGRPADLFAAVATLVTDLSDAVAAFRDTADGPVKDSEYATDDLADRAAALVDALRAAGLPR